MHARGDDPSRGLDRRRSIRIYKHLPAADCAIQPLDPLAPSSLEPAASEPVELRDLSRRGLCVRCPHPWPATSRVIVRIDWPGGETPIEMIGRTCWQRVVRSHGPAGAHAAAEIGVELIGGTMPALERYEAALRVAPAVEPDSLAALQGLG